MMVTIPKDEIVQLIKASLKNAGLTDDDAISTISTHLLQNEMAGKRSHGLLRVRWSYKYIKKNGAPEAKPVLALDAGGLGIVDGRNNLGLVAAQYAAEVAIEKAMTHGIAFVGARNHFGTTGTMNFYNRMFVEHGLIGIAGCNSLSQVCHPNGYDPVVGTNPISFGIPSAKTPCVVDVTTAEWAYGKLMELDKAGKKMPEGVIIDKDGQPSDKLSDAKDGAILPLKGFKGFSIGLAIEILSGGLIGAKMGMNAVEGSDGIFFITIDPDKLVGSDVFEAQVEALLQEVKASRHDAHIDEILIPGERSEGALRAAQGQDTLEIIDTVYNDLKEMAYA